MMPAKKTCCLCNACLFSSLLPSHLAIQHAVQYTLTSSCDLSHDDYSFMSLFSSIYFLSYPIFASLFQGPTFISCSLAPLVFHPSLAPFFVHPALGDSSAFHVSFFYTFYTTCIGADCQGKVHTSWKLELPTWPFLCCACIKR